MIGYVMIGYVMIGYVMIGTHDRDRVRHDRVEPGPAMIGTQPNRALLLRAHTAAGAAGHRGDARHGHLRARLHPPLGPGWCQLAPGPAGCVSGEPWLRAHAHVCARACMCACVFVPKSE